MNIERKDIHRESIVPPEVYMKNQSLKELIDTACDPNILLTPELITNIVLRYIFVIRYPELADSKDISLHDIEFFVGVIMKQRKLVYSGIKEVEITDKEVGDHFTFIRQTRYQTSMLIDIASTVAIFMDITTRKNASSSDTYIGIDLGTGSGILLLAQYIQARRNGYSKVINIGIEKDIMARYPGTRHVQKVADILDFGRVVQGDTTDGKKYNALSGDHIHFVSNETIPNPHVSMGKSNTGECPDPFFFNYEALFSTLRQGELDHTGFFPSKIGLEFKLAGIQREIEGTQENNFGVTPLSQIEDAFRNKDGVDFSLDEGWRIYNEIYPKWIELQGRKVDLLKSGEAFYRSGLIHRNPSLNIRWISESQAKTNNPLFV